MMKAKDLDKTKAVEAPEKIQDLAQEKGAAKLESKMLEQGLLQVTDKQNDNSTFDFSVNPLPTSPPAAPSTPGAYAVGGSPRGVGFNPQFLRGARLEPGTVSASASEQVQQQQEPQQEEPVLQAVLAPELTEIGTSSTSSTPIPHGQAPHAPSHSMVIEGKKVNQPAHEMSKQVLLLSLLGIVLLIVIVVLLSNCPFCPCPYQFHWL